ncbi:MAG TPA: LysR family transcriptional regulator [Mycobacteriales bacterium]|nr:LysR family transcriptional regulator [Mycobacteriales bacterium]
MVTELDLNLLRVFDALLDAGSVTGAAERLHLSVPATSRALGRLRRAMGDPILVRAGRGLTPTPFALRAAPQVKLVLDGARAVLTGDRDIDPATLQRSFAVRINDGIAATLVAPLLAAIAAEAPGVTLRMVAEGLEDIDSLRDGSVDLDVGVHDQRAPDLRNERLYDERLVGFVGPASALAGRRRPSVRQLCSAPHVSASRRGRTRGPFDEAIEAAGHQRRVAAVVPSFAVAMLAASVSDLVALVPERLARGFGAQLGGHWFSLPVELPAVVLSMQWHGRFDHDPAHTWLREQVRRSVA